MKKRYLQHALLASLICFCRVAYADNAYTNLNTFQRFVTYPHIEKGLSSINNQDYQRAIEEFKQVRAWAPKSPQTAIYLANAYSLNGQYDDAKKVLEDQLQFTPNDPEIASAFKNYRNLASHYQLVNARKLPPKSPELKEYLSKIKPYFYNAFDEQGWLSLLAQNFAEDPKMILNYLPRYPQNQAFQIDIALKAAIASGDYLFVQNYIESLASKLKGNPELLDSLSYQLSSEGANKEALQLLLNDYPFLEADSALQTKLFKRLALIIEKNPRLLNRQEAMRLKIPLKNPELRSIQANLFANLKDCPAVRSILGNFSQSHSESEWRMLGQCYQDVAPGLAEYSYQKAMALNPNTANTRAFAYQAFSNQNYEQSLNAWRSIPIDKLSTDDLESAALTAVTAKNLELANAWLTQFETLSGKPNALYWWLKAQIVIRENPALAAQYLYKAIAIKPTVDYYSQLASIEEDLKNPKEAIALLQKALILDPSNTNTQASLAFAYYQAGNLKESRNLLNSAYKLNPDNPQVIEQLAYANQRLGFNQDSMHFTELAINNIDQTNPSDLTPATKEKLFGLRRMHEDLGRRWTMTLDATGGNQVSAVPYSSQPGLSARSYSQAELAYRLGNPAIDDGKTLSAYARVFAGSGVQNSAIPIYAPMIAGGLRWKPFSNQAINLAVEEQTPLDKTAYSQTTAMLRASASFFNTGKFSDDWHPNGTGWYAQNLYLDAAHYMTSGLGSLTADYRISRHQKIADGQTIEPYTHLQWNELNNQVNKDVRIGLGVRWNWWGGQSQYDAYPHKTSLGIEFQHAFTTYLNERQAVFLTFGGRW